MGQDRLFMFIKKSLHASDEVGLEEKFSKGQGRLCLFFSAIPSYILNTKYNISIYYLVILILKSKI